MTAPAPRNRIAELETELARLREAVTTLARAESQTRKAVRAIIGEAEDAPDSDEAAGDLDPGYQRALDCQQRRASLRVVRA